jgi:hypothetical protein
VQRLEEVRLADAVRADGEDEAGPERELEPRIRAVVRELERLDDQAVLTVCPVFNRGDGSA